MSVFEFDRLLLDLRRPLYWFALSLTKDRDAAQDLLQDSMLRALTFRDKFQDGTNFKAWLFTIMKNTFINGHRHGKRTRAVMDRMVDRQLEVRTHRASSNAEGSLLQREIQTGLDRLSPTFREPFMRHQAGFKYEEIAQEMSIPLGTVKSRIHEARSRLMRMLEQQ